MKISELLLEGGWETTATQSTVITPSVVNLALGVMKNQFIPKFNKFLSRQGVEPVKMGHPTGSSAHFQKDPEETIYGDIDLQLIVPIVKGKNTSFWATQVRNFIKTNRLTFLHPENGAMLDRHEGNGPIVKIGAGKYIQIDIMPHTENLSKWGRFRATSERGIKGLLNGNIFSVLGTMFDFNLQHSGVQYKTVGQQKVNYANTRNDYELQNIGTNINTFVSDIFKHEVNEIKPNNVVVHPLLKQYQGVQDVDNAEDLRIQHLVNAVKGLAYSFEKSGMYGQGDLGPYRNSQEFLNNFVRLYMEKSQYAINNKKFNKAIDPAAVERAKSDKESIAKGAEYVKSLFTSTTPMPRYIDWRKQNETA
jgi:hypothetical protein